MASFTNQSDYQFPDPLFPSYYKRGPPDSAPGVCAGGWGSYDQVSLQGDCGPQSSWKFTPSHQVKGETWHNSEPVPLPLLSPQNSVWPWTLPDPLDFREHMHNFYMDHSQDAFGSMAEILLENFNFKQGAKDKCHEHSINMWRIRSFLEMLNLKICHKAYSNYQMNKYNLLMTDVVHTICPVLLGSLLHEELTEQRDRLLFSEGATGGALAFVPFQQCSSSRSQLGCLLYPGKQGKDCLNFHKVELLYHKGVSSYLDASSSNPVSFQLKGPIRQISTSSLFNDCCVAVRSDYLCGLWKFSESNEPRLLQVINTKEAATCVSVSPHVLGEVLVAGESGAANLWTVGRGMQMVRQEHHNLYFNAKSSWRWCEFSAHPRVMLYADRTGVELTDIRESPTSSSTLFSISSTSACRKGERVFLSRYLGDVHSFHHLITTQFSAYIMDERFPTVPMLKFDHMMEFPPIFCHTVPGSASLGSAVGGARTTKVMLGSQYSQEITLLQYSGGRVEACSSRGPPQSLLRPKDSLKNLPVQLPHRLNTVNNRLSSPAAGLTCIQKKGGREAAGDECICVLQLMEVGDIFYQILEPEREHADASGPRAAEGQLLPQQAAALKGTTKMADHLQPDSQQVATDTRSDGAVIEPTQGLTALTFVAETPEKEQGAVNSYSSSGDSELAGQSRTLKQLRLQVVVNDPEADQFSGLEEGKEGKNKAHGSGGTREKVGHSTITTVNISNSTRVMWKHWLQKLCQKNHSKKPRLRQMTTETSGFLEPSADEGKDPTHEEYVQNLRRDLKASMSKRSLVVHSSIPDPFGAPDVVPLPNQVNTDHWRDRLSQRLTVSWKGEEAWNAWWEEHLGLNTDKKVEALRRKRSKQKAARRAASQHLDLSDSFTTTVSFQSELDDFSDVTALSPGPSQGAWSDTEGTTSQLEGFGDHASPRAAKPSTLQKDNPVLSQTMSSKILKDNQGDQQIPSSFRTLSPSQSPTRASTPTSQRKNKRGAEDYLGSLVGPQDRPLQHDGDFVEEGITVHPLRSPVASTWSWLRSSQSIPPRSLKVDLSKDNSVKSSFSQPSSQSQSSQGQLGLSQASQPKKRSRMGF